METELLPKVISGTGISSLAASLSQSEEEQMGSLVDVTVHPAIAIEREEGVVVSSWGTGWSFDTACTMSRGVSDGYVVSTGSEFILNDRVGAVCRVDQQRAEFLEFGVFEDLRATKRLERRACPNRSFLDNSRSFLVVG